MAGVDIPKERGRVTGVDLDVLRGNHVDMVKKLKAPQLINELFQNEVIDQDDIILINKEHVKGRRQGVEQMLSIIHESGPKAFDGFVKSLRMAGFTDMAERLHKEHRSRRYQQNVANYNDTTKAPCEDLQIRSEHTIATLHSTEMRSELYNLSDKIDDAETKTQELRTENEKLTEKLNNCQKEIKELKDNFAEQLNDLTEKYKNLEDEGKMKDKQINEIMEKLCVLEGRSSDKFNFAKHFLHARFNTDERKTVKWWQYLLASLPDTVGCRYQRRNSDNSMIVYIFSIVYGIYYMMDYIVKLYKYLQ